MRRSMNAQAAFVATPVAHLTRLAKSARQVIDEPEVDVRVVAELATSRRCSALRRPLLGRPVNRGKERSWPRSCENANRRREAEGCRSEPAHGSYCIRERGFFRPGLPPWGALGPGVSSVGSRFVCRRAGAI